MRRNSAGIVSKSNRLRRQRLIEAVEPRILMSGYALTDVASFTSSTGYGQSAGLVMDPSGDLFGTTRYGGANSDGTVFEVAAGGGSITTLASFSSSTGYGVIGSLAIDSSGNLYGNTQYGGGNSDGTLFKYSASGGTLSVLASFSSVIGYTPTTGLVWDSNGNLIGANRYGASGHGALFEYNTSSSMLSVLDSLPSNAFGVSALTLNSSNEIFGATTLGNGGDGTLFQAGESGGGISVNASFTSGTGYGPQSGLTLDSQGDLFGTTNYSSGADDGTVFEDVAGSGLEALASFSSSTGYVAPGGVLRDSAGDLFGSTSYGGSNSDGTVFEITAGSSTITTLANFSNSTGYRAEGGLIANASGDLFGVLGYGAGSGDGAVYELTPLASQAVITSQPTSVTAGASQSVTVSLETPAGQVDASNTSTVTLSIASGPTGATIGGTTSVWAVNGVASFTGLTFSQAGVYTLTAASNGLTSATSNSFTIVQNYSDVKLADLSNSLGKYPEELVMDSSGNMYGVTNQGGESGNDGAVYKIVAGTHSVTLLASFSAPSATSGAFPQSGLTIDSSGNLWGTTSQGGTNSAGVIYKIANGSSTITTVASLPRVGNNITAIDDNLAIDSSGDLFGASQEGSDGFVFELPANSSSVSIVHSFSGSDGANPVGSVIVGPNGILYGTTTGGGSDGDGTVYQISNGTLTTLATFNGSGNGSGPEGTPVMDSNGDLFGTTNASGANGDGTVWEIPAGSTLTTLAAFNNTDGTAPQRGQLVLDSGGDLYGTTYGGGSSSEGTAWELPAGTGTIVTLANFTNATGYNPPVGLLMDSNGNLFGATTSGAANTYGSVFELTPSATQAVFTTAPTSVTTDAPQSITVNLEDAGGQTDVSNSSTVTLSIASGPAGATLGGTTSVSAVNGVATFSGVTFSTVGTYTLTASSSGLASSTSSSIVFAPATDVWSGSGDDTTWTSGANWQGGYAPVSGQSVDFPYLVSNQTTISLPQNVTVGDLTVGGFYVLTSNTISATGNVTSNSTNPNAIIESQMVLTHNTTVTVGAGDYLNLRSPGNGGNGYGITKDGAGYLELYGSSEPSVTTEAAQGTLEVDNTTIGSVTVDSGATLQGNGSINGIAVNGGTIRPSDNNNDATTLNSSGPVSLGSGSTFDVLITQGMSGQPDGKLVATGSAVNLTGSSLVLAVQNGFTPTIGTVITLISNQTGSAVTGTFSGLAQATVFQSGGSWFKISYAGGSSQHDVTLTATTSPATQAVFTAQPSTTVTAGNNLSFTVSLESGSGVVDVNNTSNVTLLIDSGPTGAAIGGTLTESAVAGVASFSLLTLDTVGTYTLTASSNGLTSATSETITVTPGAPDHLVFEQQPTIAVAGQSLASVVVNVVDQYGNVCTGDNSDNVNLSGTSLTGTPTTVLTVGGQATFTGLAMTLAGNQTLTAGDGALATPTTVSNSIAVTPSAASKLVIAQQPTSAIEGTDIGAVIVDVEDAYGNLVTGDTSTVSLAAADGSGVGGTDSAAAVAGVATFSSLSITLPGQHALVASDGSLTTATTSSISVAPALETLAITAPASSVTRGQTLQVTASGTDGAGAPFPLGMVTWSLDNGSVGSIDQNGLFTAGDISNPSGTAIVRATCDGRTTTDTITVNAIPPVITLTAYAQMISNTNNTGTLHVQAEQAGTDANLIYTWSIISQPEVSSEQLGAGVGSGAPDPLALFAINGTNSAKNTPITFLASGNYTLQVVASNGAESTASQVQVTVKVQPAVAKTAMQVTKVSSVQPVQSSQSITGFVVTFNGPLDPTTAQDVSGYRILDQSTVDNKLHFAQWLFGIDPGTQTQTTAYKIASAVYDSQTYSVTLNLAAPMPMKNGVRLVEVLGTGKHAVLDANGKAIDGDSNGKPGGNFTYRFTMSVARTVSYKTTSGDLVKLSLSGPGKIVTIMPSNTATPVIDLLDTDPADSILTGTLHKGRKGLGYAVIDQLNGSASADVQLGDEFHVNAVE